MSECPINLDDTPELCSAGTCDKCIGRKMKWLQSELSASKAREAALMEELAEQVRIGKDLVEHDVWRGDEMREYERQIDSLKQRAEAAEDKLKEISEAPVVATIQRLNGATVDLNLGGLARHALENGVELELKVGDELIIRPTIKE